MVDMVGPGGEAMLQSAFLSMLPTAEIAITLESAVQSAQVLQQGELFSFCSPSAQGSIRAAAEMINSMLQGHGPSFSMATPFYSQVKVQLQYFCRYHQPAKDGPSVELVGPDALQAMWSHVKAKGHKKLAMTDLEPFHVFNWLLAPSEQEVVNDLTAKVLAMVDKKFETASAKKAASKAAGGAVKKKCQPSDDVQAALSLFS